MPRTTQGRPRADGTIPVDPRKEIVSTATRMFSEQGYSNTTMSQIARLCGMRQSSLYYWFSNKEDLLRATAAVNRHAASVAQLLLADAGDASAKLHRLLYEDTKAMCLGPCDYNEIERLAYQRPDEFAVFWDDYRVLFDTITSLIVAGQEQGRFPSGGDVSWTAATALVANEGFQKMHRYHAGKASQYYLPLPAGASAGVDSAIDTFALASASTTLQGLLADVSQLPHVVAASRALSLGGGPTHLGP